MKYGRGERQIRPHRFGGEGVLIGGETADCETDELGGTVRQGTNELETSEDRRPKSRTPFRL